MAERENFILQTKDFVKNELAGAEGGHDWFHIDRVYKNALLIAQYEEVDLFTVQLASLLHDIADRKFTGGDEALGPRKAQEFLHNIGVDTATAAHVAQIIAHVSYSKSLEELTFDSPELAVVQDADRLDALGAIGIARTFNYGGYKNRVLYDPAIPPQRHMTADQYKKTEGPTINHFHEKLLLLKDQMRTATGKAIAAKRHQYMLDFLEQFHQEWEGHR